MAHFAEIDENNKVIRVLVINDSDAINGQSFLAETLNLGGRWIQTSYNGNIRFNYAAIGYTYDSIDDAFVAPMPECGHDELSLNTLKRWECSNDEHNKKS